MSIVEIIIVAWLLILTIIVFNIPVHFRAIVENECKGTARAVTNNVSDWFRNHVAMYKHEEAKAEELMPACDREKLAQKILKTHLDINPKTGRPYKTSKKVRDAQARYRNKKRGKK